MIKTKSKVSKKNQGKKSSVINLESNVKVNKKPLKSREAQFKIARFHIPTARVSSKFKLSVAGNDHKNSIEEIKRGKNMPLDKLDGGIQIPIEDMSDKTRAFVTKSQELYNEYLSKERNIKERKAYEKNVVTWNELNSEVFNTFV